MRIGLDLGGTKIEGVVLDDDFDEKNRIRRPTPVQDGYEAVLSAVTEVVAELEAGFDFPLPVGIGTPGTISQKTGMMKNSNTTSLNHRPFKRDLEEHLKREIRMANDANCFALSEALDGAAKGYGVVFGVILGTGVGGGLVVNGRIHEGPNSIAGEWGHNVLDESGPPCYCGKSGCVETFLSGPGLEADYRTLGGAKLSGVQIAQRLVDGELLAGQVFERYIDRFGKALANLIGVLDPDAIVVGGGLSNIDALYTRASDAVLPYLFSDEMVTPVLKNRHGDSSGVRGAAFLWE